jgi:hypothetical protein
VQQGGCPLVVQIIAVVVVGRIAVGCTGFSGIVVAKFCAPDHMPRRPRLRCDDEAILGFI